MNQTGLSGLEGFRGIDGLGEPVNTTPPVFGTDILLLEDGTSKIMLEDGTSFLLIES